MSRIILIFVFIGFCLNVTSRDDVTKMAKKFESNNPQSFWYKLGSENPQVISMKKAIEKKKPAMQIVAEAFGDLSSIRQSARNNALYSSKYSNIIRHIYEITGIRDVYTNVEFFVVEDKEIGACMYPEGTCIINSGLIDNASNMEEIIAVVAHEIAHFVLWHAINDAWRTAKAVRRNKTWADVGTVMAAGAYGASQMYSAQNGVQQSNSAQQQMYNNIFSVGVRIREEIGLRTDIFTRLRYMRETESEADETAFWFLEKNGIDPIYLISILKKLDVKTPSYLKKQKVKTKYSSHPDMANRIQTLESMYNKYHIPTLSQNPLPELSSNKSVLSMDKEKMDISNVEAEKKVIYVDKTGKAHSINNCSTLEENGLDRVVEVESLKEEPTFCWCVTDNFRWEIREILKQHDN